MIELRIYAKPDGEEPFTDWLRGLRDAQARARIRARLARLSRGNAGDSKSLRGGLMELRVDHGPGYRVYGSRRGDVLVLLICGGDKRTQAADIETARVYLKDWEARGET